MRQTDHLSVRDDKQSAGSQKLAGIPLRRIITILVFVIGIYLFQLFSSWIGERFAGVFSYSLIDPNGAFMWIIIHHIVQALAALILIVIFSKTIRIDFGFRVGNLKLGLKCVAIAALVLAIYMVVSYYVGHNLGLINKYAYPLDARNVTGTLIFQFFFSGTSEEILFRALPISLLGYVWHGKSLRSQIAISGIVALLFAIAHIRWSVGTSGLIASYDWIQLAFAFVLGTFQGIIFQRTGSVYYSMAVHSISNVLATVGGYVYFLYII